MLVSCFLSKHRNHLYTLETRQVFNQPTARSKYKQLICYGARALTGLHLE